MPETELHVEFDQPQEVFFPGYPISGRVVLLTEDKYKAKTVNIKFEGIAHTYWDDDSSVRRTEVAGQKIYYNQRVHYSADVNYLEHKLLLWSSGDGSVGLKTNKVSITLIFLERVSTGKIRVAVLFLPNDIPPSFEGKYGYVRYSVTAEVDRPWRFDKAKKLCITVSPLLDLNINPHAMTPLQDQASENLGCCCFKKGYLEMRVNIPKTGFVPGETVPINLEILNHSSVPVEEVKAKIIQKCSFVAVRNGSILNYLSDSVTHRIEKQETKQDTNTVVKQTQALTVEPGKEHKLVLELRLPSVTPTINQFSPIITVEYLVQLSVDTSIVFGSDINCEMSLLIGTVPIRQYLPPSYYPPNPALPSAIPTPMPTQIGSRVVVPPPEYGFVTTPADIGTGVVPPYPEGAQPYPTKGDTVGVPSAPPVSYQDSMYGPDGTQLNTDENDKPFVPKYPVFDNLPVYNPSAPPQE